MVIKAEKEWTQITLKAMCPEISGGVWYLLLHLSKIPEVEMFSETFFYILIATKKNVRNYFLDIRLIKTNIQGDYFIKTLCV